MRNLVTNVMSVASCSGVLMRELIILLSNTRRKVISWRSVSFVLTFLLINMLSSKKYYISVEGILYFYCILIKEASTKSPPRGTNSRSRV